MAQGDLHRLLSRVTKELARSMTEQGSEEFRKHLNSQTHDIFISRDQFRDELLIQIQDFRLARQLKAQGIKRTDSKGAQVDIVQASRYTYGSRSGNTREQAAAAVQSMATTEGLTPAQIAVVEKQADLFVKRALATTTLPPGKRRNLTITKISGDKQNFTLRFRKTGSGRVDVFGRINDLIFKDAKDLVSKALNGAGFKIDKSEQLRIFNVGHVTSVSEVKSTRALWRTGAGLSKIYNQNSSDPVVKDLADSIRLEMVAKFSQLGDPEFTKQFIVRRATVKVESEATNMTDSDYEAALLREVRTHLESVLKKMPNDWAGQKSSDSIKELIAKDIVATATKRASKRVKVKVAGDINKDLKSNAASSSFKYKRPRQKPAKKLDMNDFGKFDIPSSVANAPAPSPINLTSLLPIINERLPEVIRSHMGRQGRLVNRTGRFSESARVIAVDDSGLSMGYTYQVRPYSVFESQGARDPRPLIEMSIREIAREAMITRFSLRRI